MMNITEKINKSSEDNQLSNIELIPRNMEARSDLGLTLLFLEAVSKADSK
jgi:hypothetical protein